MNSETAEWKDEADSWSLMGELLKARQNYQNDLDFAAMSELESPSKVLFQGDGGRMNQALQV